jgi:hypothetical protein
MTARQDRSTALLRRAAICLRVLQTVLKEGLPRQAEQPDERTRRISDQLVRLVQVFFGVVAGQGLVLYHEVVVSPLQHNRIPAALALTSIYVMIVWSWIDWNSTMDDRPYDFRSRARTTLGRWQTRFERWRLYSDIVIVVLYSYMLFQVAPLVNHPNFDIRYLLLGYPLVFALYLVSGELRILRYGRPASNIQPILEHLVIFIALFIVYILLRQSQLSEFWLNCSTLAIAIALTRAYRWRRRRYSEARKK